MGLKYSERCDILTVNNKKGSLKLPLTVK